ncbi:PASTA domain-containing protein [Streptomyces sp. DSM 41527]|uniref:PASTA domain-containing protein n=1 Tax=Streptomyces mooreae TaxID=3075523 RepID=A0ABU2T1M2_9ACTN|nr:PASTA domain-containing protein [Streptomyces sp. DSM 41527]MDT0454504.1 PASTA domain-containing protein [Streptomyces sp. DSM 41527]
MVKRIVTASVLTVCCLVPAVPAQADGPRTMPQVAGQGLVSAYAALRYDTSVRLKDGRGAGRHVLWPAGWKVCAQDPAAGTDLRGRRVTLTVVKRTESCR